MNRAKRRYDSIIPLSREHHYALLLCLRIHRGVKQFKQDRIWLLQQTRKTILFFETNLVAHFDAEETVLFPTMTGMTEGSALIETLLKEHEAIRTHMEHLRGKVDSTDSTDLAGSLNHFADVLEAHIRKEERQLFPIYEKKITKEADTMVAKEIQERIGNGMYPKHPETLE